MKTIVTKTKEASNLIDEALKIYGEKSAVFCSFGKDSMVVLHLALQVNPKIKVVAVMTRFKPKETIEYMWKLKHLWNFNLEVYQSEESCDCFGYDPDECCRMNKEEPTKRALEKLDAWICGLRRTEGNTRTDFNYVEETDRSYLGQKGKIVKINPILDWDEVDIWKYMAIHEIPVHPWYAEGYRSLGCAPCTHIVDDHETERAGRWKYTPKCGGECGIHTMARR